MNRLEWRAGFATGVKSVDSEHRRLIALVGDMFDKIGSGNLDEYGRIVDKFVDDIETHFRTEVDFLESIDFPDVVRHREAHEQLLARIKGEQGKLKAEAQAGKMEQHYEAIVRILLEDIVDWDSRFKSFAQHKGAANH